MDLNADQALLGVAVAQAKINSTGPTQTFEFTDLPPGTYFLNAVAPADSSNLIDDRAFDGFYASTPGQTLSTWNATPIKIGSAPVCNVDFTVGKIPCYASWGSACTVDGECRATVCTCTSGMKALHDKGACDPVANTCRQAATDADCAKDCAKAGNASGPPSQASCFNL
jgi:hypothetical protein